MVTQDTQLLLYSYRMKTTAHIANDVIAHAMSTTRGTKQTEPQC